MSTYSTLNLVNKALLLCGASPITALTEDSVNGRAVNASYDIARKTILCECKWTFATTRSTLATVATTKFAWLYDEEGYGYTRPSAALKIFAVSDPYATWREEGELIVADTADLGLLYVFDQDDASKWPPTFVDALMDKLCSDISFHILNDARKAQMYLEKYEKISLPKAMSSNSQVGKHQTIIDGDWTDSKFANGGTADPSRSYS